MTQPPQQPYNQPYGGQPQYYGQQPQPGQYPSNFAPVQPPAPKKGKKWPWVAGGVAAFVVIAGVAGGGSDKDESTTAAAPTTTTTTQALPPVAAAAAPTTTTAAVVAEVELPEVAGRNGEIVRQELADLGLTNVTLGSADPNSTLVIMAANWTAVSIEPAPGTIVAGDDPVVVTLTKK
ncbi:hypothetical protein [Rhodococcus zopfii]|uniref:hypothetical protein n=1 Tax=Rhodococcus zopfii TaxID=43772 RepID=UPI0009342480|nr:hypothetical protein [Rhodococcus zopfii]